MAVATKPIERPNRTGPLNWTPLNGWDARDVWTVQKKIRFRLSPLSVGSLVTANQMNNCTKKPKTKTTGKKTGHMGLCAFVCNAMQSEMFAKVQKTSRKRHQRSWVNAAALFVELNWKTQTLLKSLSSQFWGIFVACSIANSSSWELYLASLTDHYHLAIAMLMCRPTLSIKLAGFNTVSNSSVYVKRLKALAWHIICSLTV